MRWETGGQPARFGPLGSVPSNCCRLHCVDLLEAWTTILAMIRFGPGPGPGVTVWKPCGHLALPPSEK